MRIAWTGPTPGDEGVPYVATQLLAGLARLGVEVDCFVAASKDSLPKILLEEPALDFVCAPAPWALVRPRGRTPVVRFVTGQAGRAVSLARFASLIAERHAARPYDLLYQFSQIELLYLRRLIGRLPPVVLHPQVHAAGELRWHRQEARLASQCEPARRRAAVRAMLAARAAVQRRDVRKARMIVAISPVFAAHLSADYGLPPGRIRVVPSPIDTVRFRPGNATSGLAETPLRLLFVSRMAVRKGVEMVVGLSHRLSDLAGKVRIDAVGGWSMWSDYRPLLQDLNSGIAAYLGPRPYASLPELYRQSDALLQPSHYEPFALTVGEALASGLPVVASDEVGAVEGVDPGCCTVFQSGDLDAFESAVRALVARLQRGGKAAVGTLARREAVRLFSLGTVAAKLADVLEGAVSARAPSATGAGG